MGVSVHRRLYMCSRRMSCRCMSPCLLCVSLSVASDLSIVGRRQWSCRCHRRRLHGGWPSTHSMHVATASLSHPISALLAEAVELSVAALPPPPPPPLWPAAASRLCVAESRRQWRQSCRMSSRCMSPPPLRPSICASFDGKAGVVGCRIWVSPCIVSCTCAAVACPVDACRHVCSV